MTGFGRKLREEDEAIGNERSFVVCLAVDGAHVPGPGGEF